MDNNYTDIYKTVNDVEKYLDSSLVILSCCVVLDKNIIMEKINELYRICRCLQPELTKENSSLYDLLDSMKQYISEKKGLLNTRYILVSTGKITDMLDSMYYILPRIQHQENIQI